MVDIICVQPLINGIDDKKNEDVDEDNDENYDNAALNPGKKVYLLPKGKTRPDHPADHN